MLGLALARDVPRRELAHARLLALGSAPVYAGSDLFAGRRLSPAYYADVALQALFAAAWLAGGRRSRGSD